MKKENGKNKNIVSLSISIGFFLVLIFSAAYALIGAQITYDESNITAVLGTRPVFVSDSSDQIILDIPYIGAELDETVLLADGTGSVKISLSTGYNVNTECTYDLYWVWDETSDPNNQYTKTAGATKEYTISGTDGTNSFGEVQLNNYNPSNLKTKLYTGSIVADDGLAFKIWTLTARFYKPSAIQSSHYGSSYSGKVTVENVICTSSDKAADKPLLSDYVISLANGEDRNSSQTNGGVYKVEHETFTATSGDTVDAGYRYEGKDPDNYVTFNGSESWRIIGVFEGSTIGLESGKYYTKLIKSASIGNYRWDETRYVNNWVNASLNTYLTNTYLPSMDDASEGMIAYATYYLGGAPSSAETGYTSAQFYTAERGSTGGGASFTTVSHQNYLGLMYPSDYGYAMYAGSANSGCTTDLVVYNYSTSFPKCANYDWMLQKTNEWTITPVSDASGDAFRVDSTGYVFNVYVGSQVPVRPVLYLEASVIISGGSGTSGDPYTLK